MRTTLPLIISFVVGLFMLGEFFVPHWYYQQLKNELLEFGIIIATAAVFLGIVNLLQVNLPKITNRERDWGYKVIMLGSMIITMFVGLWEGQDRMEVYVCKAVGDIEARDFDIKQGETDQFSFTVHIQDSEVPAEEITLTLPTEEPQQQIITSFNQPLPTLEPKPPTGLTIATALQQQLSQSTNPAANSISIKAMDISPSTTVEAEKTYALVLMAKEQNVERIEIGNGTANAPLGFAENGVFERKRNFYKWFFDFIFIPLSATMFALLAFYIASAAFRAFRARNIDATILLIAACVVMLAQVPIGKAMLGEYGTYLVQFKNWLMDVPNVAARRAIFIGAALGAIATGLRIVLGIERSHLGGD